LEFKAPESRLQHIRPAIAVDIPSIMALERLCAMAAHWAEAQYRRAIQPTEQGRTEYLVLVAEDGLALQGFLAAHQVHPEWELQNVVVSEESRRTGIANRLMDEFLGRARETDGEAVFLEVRESNDAAQALYRKWGFEPCGRRKSYYANPIEDAMLYRLRLR